MKFCSNCGAPLARRVPPGDSLPRDVCDACGSIHYANPKLVLGAIPEWDGRLLLCRRAIEPRYGYWTLPAGFMENGETAAEGALRETLEEITSFGDGGRQPGQFFGVHSIATDSKGNIFTTETYRGQRVQKFVFKGVGPVVKQDQGVVWPKTAKSPL